MSEDLRQQVEMTWRERTVQIEYEWTQCQTPPQAVCIMLHEGLGSTRMWRDFPQKLSQRMPWKTLLYSRPGYGGSSPRPHDEELGCDFMHRQAYEVLPAMCEALAIDRVGLPVWLLGHSDGASIALLYASRFGTALAGCIALAPHVMVEPITVASIELARHAYIEGDLRARLQRYHEHVDSAFWGWNNIWLHPDFRSWSIEEEVRSIRCPVLLLQGNDDEYGTYAQIAHIQSQLPQAQATMLDHCGHSPHRDAPARVLDAIEAFCSTHV